MKNYRDNKQISIHQGFREAVLLGETGLLLFFNFLGGSKTILNDIVMMNTWLDILVKTHRIL